MDGQCRHVNDKLRRLAAMFPDVASLSPLDYDCTSKRADVDVLQTLVECAKKLKVNDTMCCNYPACTCLARNKAISSVRLFISLSAQKLPDLKI